VEWFDPTPDSIIFNPIVWTFELKQNLRTAPIQGHYDFDVQDLRHDALGNVYLLVQVERWDFQFCTDCNDAFIDAWNEVFKISPEGELISHKRLRVTEAVVSAMGFVHFDDGDMLIRIDDINAAGTALETTLYDVDSDLEIDDVVALGKQYQHLQVANEDEFVALSNSFDPNDPLSLGLTDMILSRLDEDGGLVWSKRIGGAGYDFSKGLLVFEDDIVILANTDSGDHDVADPQGFTDIWIANFSMEPLSNDDHTIAESIGVYPNPASHQVYLKVAQPIERLRLYDLAGRLMAEENHIQAADAIDVSRFPEGMYIIRGMDQAGREFSGKVSVSR
jgi:hypothetical protein